MRWSLMISNKEIGPLLFWCRLLVLLLRWQMIFKQCPTVFSNIKYFTTLYSKWRKSSQMNQCGKSMNRSILCISPLPLLLPNILHCTIYTLFSISVSLPVVSLWVWVFVNVCKLSFRWLALETLLQQPFSFGEGRHICCCYHCVYGS